MYEIKFGTDGWRAIIGREFTVENVSRVAEGVAAWLFKKKSAPVAIIGYDTMYGAGQNVMKKLLPGISFLHSENNPGFNGTAPEPILKNLTEFSSMIKEDGKIDCGLATDGDADRLGLFDNKGNFIDSHHIILLLIHYLVKYKNMKGKVCCAFSTTPRVAKLSKHYGFPLETVKIGFKYISEIMDN